MEQPDEIRRKNRDLVILFILALLALVTRVYGIWDWSLIGDEYYTVMYAAERSKGLINPAYYALVLGSIKLFGLTEWSARLPSMILGVLGVLVFYSTFRSMLDRKTAFIGSLLLIFCSWHIYHSQLSRFYSGVFLFGILSYYLYYIALRRDNYWFLGGALLSNVLGILFHATSIMVPAACAMFSAFIVFWKKADTSDYSKRVARAHLIVCVVIGLILLPFFSHLFLTQSGRLLSGPIGVLVQLTNNVEITLAISSLFGLIFMLQKDFSKGIFFAFGIGIPLFALLLTSVLIPPIRAKYMIYSLPLIIALSAFLCAEISSVLSRYSFAKNAMTFLVIAGMMPGFVSYYTAHRSLDVREAIDVIEQGYKPGDKIVALSHSYHHLLKDFPDESLRIVGGKGAWRGALKPFEGGNHRVWIVLNTYRNVPLNRHLESWLTEHASLVWRKYEKRYDYSMMGYEIYMVNGP